MIDGFLFEQFLKPVIYTRLISNRYTYFWTILNMKNETNKSTNITFNIEYKPLTVY